MLYEVITSLRMYKLEKTSKLKKQIQKANSKNCQNQKDRLKKVRFEKK